MRNIEEELKKALARQSPHADFTDRVLAAVDQRRLEKHARWAPIPLFQLMRWRLAPILAAALAVSAGTIYWKNERIERGQAVKRKLLLAMHIAGSELQQARQRVLDIDTGETKQ
jgi:hypothetical protein